MRPSYSGTSSEFLHKGDWEQPGLRPAATEVPPEDAAGAIATADPPDHTRQRKVVTRKLSTSNMQAMEPEFRALVSDALATAVVNGSLEWMSEVAEPLPMIMVARILGLPDALTPELKKQGYAMVERIGGFVPRRASSNSKTTGSTACRP